MGSKKKAPEARMPTASELAPLVDLQAQYNRVGVATPFGSQRYELGPDGRSSTLVTDIGPEGQALVGRALGLAMQDSGRMQVPGQLNDLASALMNRVGSRFGMQPGSGFELAQRPQQLQAKQPQQRPQPQASNVPQAGGINYGQRPTSETQGGGFAAPIRDALERNRSRY